MLIEFMLLNTFVFALVLIIMIIFLAAKPRKKHSKKQVSEDLNNIKEQINGED